jgi:MoaD family protein
MPVQVLYFAEFKEITKKAEENFELKESTLKELINVLIKKYKPLKGLIWDDKTQNLSDEISVVINKNIKSRTNILSTSLNNGDTIAFILPVSGG